jgi:hypothetical protein
MDNKVFYVKYLENAVVKVETHFKGEDERRRPLTDVSDLIQGNTLTFPKYLTRLFY